MDRRDFVRTLGGATLGLAAGAAGCAPAAQAPTLANGRTLRRVGIQLYALRDDARANLERTLAGIAEIGYRDVELLSSMRNFDVAPATLRAMLDRVGLRAPSTHVSAAIFDDVPRHFEEAQALGHQYLFVAGLPAERTRSLDDWRRWADQFNATGEALRKYNIWLGFHNHASDFRRYGQTIGYDAFVDRTDPRYVRHQLDTGNLAMAGHDPLDYLEDFGDRYWSFHIKDVPEFRARSDAELGKGKLDFRAVLESIAGVDEKLLYVEQESYPGTPMESARKNFQFLSTLRFEAD
jgi:sugar phosphate isomerase/epimerase